MAALSSGLWRRLVCHGACWAVALAALAAGARAEDASSVERRLADTARYLASDELEGRGIGTKGLDRAADHIADEFRKAGLETELYDGTPFQKFKMTVGAKLASPNVLTFVGPAADGGQPRRIELKVGESFNPLSLGGSGKFDLPLVFAGYGISGKDEMYDDYAGIDVKDKAVLILRHEPQQNNPHSAFAGTRPSRHSFFSRKVSNAYEHGAAAVIFVNDDFDMQKKLGDLRNNWQAAVERIVDENSTFKKIENPSADDRKAHEVLIGKLADDVKRLGDELTKADDPLLPLNGAGNDDGQGATFRFCSAAARRSSR